jgi:DNA-binding transcriptional regulator GbsR (MarR family)
MMRSRRTTQDIFIEGWGRLGPAWGISKVMAEIYALLYVSEKPLTLEEMSRTLKTSRSNVSMNVRQLLDLSVVHW